MYPFHVCILGGGFGGLYTALYLIENCRKTQQPCTITLVEPRDRFVFSPLLYELLTDELKPWEIVPAYSSLLKGTNIRRIQTNAKAIDLDAKSVELETQEVLTYDYLVVATGSRDRPLPISGWREHTYSFRNLYDLERLSERLTDLEASDRLTIRVAVVGGGPSGVELSCKLADRLGQRGDITLIERGDTILKPYPKKMQQVALQALAHRQVKLWLKTSVIAVDPLQIHTQGSSRQASHAVDLVIGTAGAQPSPWLGKGAAVQFDSNGSALTQPTLQLPAYPEVFVVGDQAVMLWQRERRAPQTAQAAYQAAATVAKNLVRLMRGRSPQPFRYMHLGEMMTLGYQNALVASAGIVLHGRLASVMRQAAYTYRLPPGGGHRWRVARYRCSRLLAWLLSKQ